MRRWNLAVSLAALAVAMASATHLSEEQHEKLPDFGNPEVRRVPGGGCAAGPHLHRHPPPPAAAPHPPPAAPVLSAGGETTAVQRVPRQCRRVPRGAGR